MRTIATILASVVLFPLLAAGPASANWKHAVFGDQTQPSITLAPRRTYRQSATATSRGNRRKASTKPRDSTERYASRGGSLSGLASYYWQPQRVASGGWFNPNALTAAHKTLPFGTRVRVTNLRNGRSVVVRINDRGPYIRGRIIDLSRRAATVVGMTQSGVVPVRVDIL